MRIFNKKGNGGQLLVNWTAVMVALVLVPALIVGSVELVWYVLTGTLSPLMGGFAAVASALALIRLIGGAIASARYHREAAF